MRTHFTPVTNKPVHHCTSYRNGDKTVWRCPLCPDYERSYNWLTGRMTVKGQNEYLHIGMSTGNQNLEGLTTNLCSN